MSTRAGAARGLAASGPALLLHVLPALLLSFTAGHGVASAQTQQPAGNGLPAALVVVVVSDGAPVEQATVRSGDRTAQTDPTGRAILSVPSLRVDIVVERFGFETRRVSTSPPADRSEWIVTVELEAEAVLEESVEVTATRTSQRIQDLPLRVEVVPQEEIDEKLSMTPGDVAMMLTETNGLRVQVTSPSVGTANVRVQGLRGRYTQMLSDGLPLYGPAGSLSVLQIPPMDLGQVEVIKGVASALYGGAALGGVINLVSRRPRDDAPEREVLVNRTSRGGTDAAVWAARKVTRHWGYTFLGGAHVQHGQDVNGEGWLDIPAYTRFVARPRLLWDDGDGRSVFVTVGGMAEDRSGGTVAGASAPDGSPFRQSVESRSVDAGVVGRFAMGNSRVLTFRSSGLVLGHEHHFGDAQERDRHHTWFAESAVTGISGRHTWVVGAAFQQDGYTARDLPRFDYEYRVPSAFAQDDYAPFSWLTASVSARLDLHDTFGTFFSPRVSALARHRSGLSARLSTGSGFFAPTPFVEDTDATGLSRVAPLDGLEAERGRSLSLDLGWRGGPLELTGTLFRSRIRNPLLLREDSPATAAYPLRIVNGLTPGQTRGTELIARLHYGDFDLIATHMYLRSTEPDAESGVRRETALNPRHSAGIDFLWELEGRARLGLEAFYTGRQRLDDSPFRATSVPYWLFGIIGEWRVRGARIFVNGENLAGFRQTGHAPLVRPTRAPDGRWLDEEWGPIDGRVLNAGVRFAF